MEYTPAGRSSAFTLPELTDAADLQAILSDFADDTMNAHGDVVTGNFTITGTVNATALQVGGVAVPALSTATPQNTGTAAPGSATAASKADHVHHLGTIAESDVTNLTADLAAKANRIYEPAPTIALATNVETLDLANSNVSYITTAPTANWTLNITNAPTTNDQAITVTVFCTQGATGYIPATLQVAGSGQTIKWAGGSAPTPTSSAGKIDIFSFTLVRKSSVWVCFGSMLANF